MAQEDNAKANQQQGYPFLVFPVTKVTRGNSEACISPGFSPSPESRPLRQGDWGASTNTLLYNLSRSQEHGYTLIVSWLGICLW